MSEKLEVLLSCMNFQDKGFLNRHNFQSDVLIINQTNRTAYEEFSFNDKNGAVHKARMLSIQQKGLSQSRNLAIDYAQGDILLIADDDENFVNSYPSLILNSFNQSPKSDVMLFNVKSNRLNNDLPNRAAKVGYIRAMKACSQQIAFRRSSIKEKGIRFDVTMGAGTNNGGGEENKFLFDCLKHKLCVTYTPKLIAHVDHSSSTWFHGYDKKFFINRGYSSRKLLGIFLGCLYVFEWSILKYPSYKKDMSFYKSLIFQMKGLFFKP